MSNNRNRNRRPQSQPQGPQGGAQGPQDKPFIFKSKTGTTIRIPAGTPYVPSARAISNLNKAMQADEGSEIASLAATFDVITSGFPAEIADTIDLALDELQTFTTAYQRFTGTDIPN